MRSSPIVAGVWLFIGLLIGILLTGVMLRELGKQPAVVQAPQLNPTVNPPTTDQPAVLQASPLASQPHDNRLGLPAQPPTGTESGYLAEELVSMHVYEKCNRSVVHIGTKSAAIRSFLQVQFREGAGSGSILDRSGLVLTNQHVIDGAREITVSLYDGSSYPAILVGQDPETDIAVLKIDAPRDKLLPIEWGNSQGLKVGQRIYAIGNPFGLERTMSTGMISSLNRQIPSHDNRTMRALIQIDASINQGNSGGPLFSTSGKLIGMNTAIMSSSGDSTGVGFAIAANTLERIVPQLIQNGHVIRPSIGITRVYETDQGLLIVSLAPGGAAERAGLQGFQLIMTKRVQGAYTYEIPRIDPSQADLIKAVDGRPISTADDLLAVIEMKQPNEPVSLSIIRQSVEMEVVVTLGEAE